MQEISAGGVVYRKSPAGLEIQLIRDRFGKISLAKGKMEPGETIEETALREIQEETGMIGRIVAPIDQISYVYTHPVHGETEKIVHYYVVEALEGDLQAQVEEIDGVSWFSPQEAWLQQKQQGYDNNDRILQKALEWLQVEVDFA
ncbi:NUDIX hydrolase [Paenibacillus guangzhouensis]|uniref:NUDIX hydrolase n=1 Tax=Paenibacillus guangzhouensis TaxID=1473112 RepID=UPI001266C5FD|nr:NUDIX domain-containing protein [Paenibacillus guangzhouensis]